MRLPASLFAHPFPFVPSQFVAKYQSITDKELVDAAKAQAKTIWDNLRSQTAALAQERMRKEAQAEAVLSWNDAPGGAGGASGSEGDKGLFQNELPKEVAPAGVEVVAEKAEKVEEKKDEKKDEKKEEEEVSACVAKGGERGSKSNIRVGEGCTSA